MSVIARLYKARTTFQAPFITTGVAEADSTKHITITLKNTENHLGLFYMDVDYLDLLVFTTLYICLLGYFFAITLLTDD